MEPEVSLAILEPEPEKTILTRRLLNAPIELGFRAWTDPELLAQWWGPKGFSNSFSTFELKPGGRWIFVMHGPDGQNYPNESEFVKIESPFFLAFNHISGHQFQVQTTFIPEPEGRCTVEFRMVFPSVEEAGQMRQFIPEKNEENLDKLEALLEKIRGL